MQLARDCNCECCLAMDRHKERRQYNAWRARKIIQASRRLEARREFIQPIAAFGEHCHRLWVQHGDKAARKLSIELRTIVRSYLRGVIDARWVGEELDLIMSSFRKAAEVNCHGV